jgi:NADH-quinone oxidoreductase subunit E
MPAVDSMDPTTSSQIAFNEKNEAKFQKLLGQYPTKQAMVLPALWLAMDQWEYLSNEVIEYVANRLDQAPVSVWAVVEFYTMFKTEKSGRHHIQLCRNMTCTMRGCEDLEALIRDRVGIGPGEKSEDGLFSLELVECLGSCGTAPVLRMDEHYFENLTEEKLDRIIKACREDRDPVEEDN